MVHRFEDSLANSERLASADWWTALYREYFGPDFVEAVQIPEDSLGQRLGVDRLVVLSTGRVFRVDEKVRYGSYGDVLLEFDSGHGPGWVCKPTLTDYVVYVTLGLRRAVFLEMNELQRAWRTNGEKWKGLYEVKIAENATYSSRSVPVPLHELLAGMRQCSELRDIECGEVNFGTRPVASKKGHVAPDSGTNDSGVR
jgi:hypothetical protein